MHLCHDLQRYIAAIFHNFVHQVLIEKNIVKQTGEYVRTKGKGNGTRKSQIGDTYIFPALIFQSRNKTSLHVSMYFKQLRQEHTHARALSLYLYLFLSISRALSPQYLQIKRQMHHRWPILQLQQRQRGAPIHKLACRVTADMLR